MCHLVNAATLDALRRGVATSATLMTPCPWAMHAMQILREHPQFPFGVHLTLVSEHAGYRWGPVASRDQVPSLTDESGHCFAHDRIPDLLAVAKIEDVEREFRAQIGTVLTANLQPTHLDFHCVADGGRADIFDLALGLAREFGLALRVHGRAIAARCRRQGLPANDHPVLDSYHLEAVDKTARYLELLRALPPGLTEWAVHPLNLEMWKLGRSNPTPGRFAGRITIFWYRLMLAPFWTRRRSCYSTTAPSRQSGPSQNGGTKINIRSTERRADGPHLYQVATIF